MPKPRSPVLGYNHNIRHKGWVFHVQTEDSGVHNPHVFTHLFREGVIIASKKIEYDPEADDDIVKGLMQAQHKSVMRALRHGAYDAKIDAYLGAAPAESNAVPSDLGDDAGATIPTAPPSVDDEAEVSSPYAQIELGDDSQSAVSGTLDVASERILLADDSDTDDEINGLLSRLREETPLPEPVMDPDTPAPAPHDPGAGTSSGTWIVARPGHKERPFDRSGPIPVPIRDEGHRRVLTPPQFEVPRSLPSPPPPGTVTRRPVATTGRSLTPPAVVSPRPAGGPGSSPPTRPLAPVAARSGPGAPAPIRPPPPPAGSAPMMGRASAGHPPTHPPVRPPPPPLSASRSQPAAPVLPRGGQSSAPMGARPGLRPPTPPTGALLPSPITVSPRRPPTTQESIVVARPAVVIGAPPTIIGGATDTTQRRNHGREQSGPSAPGESLFGQDLISEKSLDEVIMAYLSEESSED